MRYLYQDHGVQVIEYNSEPALQAYQTVSAFMVRYIDHRGRETLGEEYVSLVKLRNTLYPNGQIALSVWMRGIYTSASSWSTIDGTAKLSTLGFAKGERESLVRRCALLFVASYRGLTIAEVARNATQRKQESGI